jgi:hypothetical protein
MTSCPRCQGPLPDPPERFCPHCGAEVALLPALDPALPPLPPAVAPPASGWEPGPGAREGTPWERRGEIGFAAALVETTQRVLTGASAFFRAMPVTGGIASPLVYALIMGYAGLVISAIYDFVLESVMGSSLSRFGGGSEAMAGMAPYVAGAAGLGVKLVLGPFLVTIGLFLMSGITHLALMMLGGASRGFEATFRVACYSEAAAVLNVIPVCGGLIGPITMVVLMIIGISEAQGITRARAAAAVLLPIFVCCCCILGPIVAFVMSIAASQFK